MKLYIKNKDNKWTQVNDVKTIGKVKDCKGTTYVRIVLENGSYHIVQPENIRIEREDRRCDYTIIELD